MDMKEAALLQMEEREQPAIDRLLKKMDASPGFTGSSEVAQAVCRLIDDDGSNSKIAAAVLRDPALTAKLLNLANSDRYPRGAGNVSTIDQVLALLGMNTVKTVALSLATLSSLPNKQQSNQLHAEIVAAIFTGNFAAEVTRTYGASYGVQQAQICGLMQNLGRVMSIFHSYEDIERSRKFQIEKNLPENEAVKQILGVSFEEMGAAIALHWALPDTLKNSLVPVAVDLPPNEAVNNAMAWHQLCSLFCRRVTNVVFRLPENAGRTEIPSCVDFFQKALRLNGKEALELIEGCLRETESALAAMNFSGNVEDARNLLRKASERSTDMLSAEDSLVKKEKGHSPIEKVKHLMRLIHDHCSFDCTLICLQSGSGLAAIAGVGRNAGLLTTKFRSGGVHKDIFQVIMEKKKDTYIADVNAPSYASLVPKWYHEFVKAKSCVALPLVSEGKVLGMIYGDYLKQQDSAPSELADGIIQEWRAELILTLKYGPKGSPNA